MNSPETIIVVEDSKPNRVILCNLLKKLGYNVLEATNGFVALEQLEIVSRDHSKKLVAILSDIMMPDMDGITLLREIRNKKETESLPFVFITAMADKTSIMQAKDLKATGYLLKPVSMERVLKLLNEVFPGRTFKVPESA